MSFLLISWNNFSYGPIDYCNSEKCPELSDISAISCLPLNPAKHASKFIITAYWNSNIVEIFSISETGLKSESKTPPLLLSKWMTSTLFLRQVTEQQSSFMIIRRIGWLIHPFCSKYGIFSSVSFRADQLTEGSTKSGNLCCRSVYHKFVWFLAYSGITNRPVRRSSKTAQQDAYTFGVSTKKKYFGQLLLTPFTGTLRSR